MWCFSKIFIRRRLWVVFSSHSLAVLSSSSEVGLYRSIFTTNTQFQALTLWDTRERERYVHLSNVKYPQIIFQKKHCPRNLFFVFCFLIYPVQFTSCFKFNGPASTLPTPLHVMDSPVSLCVFQVHLCIEFCFWLLLSLVILVSSESSMLPSCIQFCISILLH